ncbi:hypothetical protein FB446DRAFT_813657 [Lentinula raphanica]|nr:hypothetical protein FB446DRAFT_813657 [Lentinula raphanica]
MEWFYNENQTKSIADLNNLVENVLLPDDFQQEHLCGFSAQKVLREMDDFGGPKEFLQPNDGWVEASVKIPVPCSGIKQKESDAPMYELKGIFYRRPLEVIKSVFQSSESKKFHYTPFRLFQKHLSGSTNSYESVRLHSELYNSDSFLDEHEKVQRQQHERCSNSPDDPSLRVPNALAAMMLWSDATQVGNWGDESMWPIYLYFGNQSKYDRAKPSSFAAHHLAYIPKLPDDFYDFYKEHYQHAPPEAVLTHMRRELMQAVWDLILDEEFMEAYENGIVLTCGDGVTRRIFPRLFTYSADYPEKVLLACLKCLGQYPCVHCLTEKNQIDQLGTIPDRRRREKKARIDDNWRRSSIEKVRTWIFDYGHSLASKAVDLILKPYSWVPTRNTFSARFEKFGFNFYDMLVPDVLHEIELGVWKAILLHLIRMLFSIGSDTVLIMNERYRSIPPFGRNTIRRINKNVSIPVFEGLFPAHDAEIRKLLFDLSSVHGFAKLRLHSDLSLEMLDDHITELGRSLRTFQKKVSPSYKTKELPKETSSRQRRKTANKSASSTSRKGKQKAGNNDHGNSSEPKPKLFNLSTYKIHVLGYYVRFIRRVGTTDGYTTQTGELEHRRVKRFYARTNKVFGYTRQVVGHERRIRVIKSIQRNLRQAQKSSEASSDPRVPFQHSDPIQPLEPERRYKISNDTSQWVQIHQFMNSNKDDPAVTSFHRKLQEHLYCRLTGTSESDIISSEQRSKVKIKLNRMYKHKVLQINYTTYDSRRCQDSINPRTYPDIMVLASDDSSDHPYWYARVIGIYHVMVEYDGGPLTQVDFLWVRWFELDAHHTFGFHAKHLPRVGFIDGSESCAFVRAVHLIPAFALRKTDKIMGPSIARKKSENDEDWVRYYVGMYIYSFIFVDSLLNNPPRFSDRDMVVRFCPDIALGHHPKLGFQQLEEPEDSSEVLEPHELDEDVPTESIPDAPPDLDVELLEDKEYDSEEFVDYGYKGEEEEAEEEDEDEEDEGDIGPEDGEDPVNHDMEILDQEGYGLL